MHIDIIILDGLYEIYCRTYTHTYNHIYIIYIYNIYIYIYIIYMYICIYIHTYNIYMLYLYNGNNLFSSMSLVYLAKNLSLLIVMEIFGNKQFYAKPLLLIFTFNNTEQGFYITNM